MRYEYCVMEGGNNVECFDTELGATIFVNKVCGDRILKVEYDNDNEVGCECVLER